MRGIFDQARKIAKKIFQSTGDRLITHLFKNDRLMPMGIDSIHYAEDVTEAMIENLPARVGLRAGLFANLKLKSAQIARSTPRLVSLIRDLNEVRRAVSVTVTRAPKRGTRVKGRTNGQQSMRRREAPVVG